MPKFEVGQQVTVKATSDRLGGWYHMPRGTDSVDIGTNGKVIAFPPPVRGRRKFFVLVESLRPDGVTDRFAAWPENLAAVK